MNCDGLPDDGLHDILRLKVRAGSGIEIRCADPRVPTDQTNTCYRIVERGMAALKAKGRVLLEIEKRLPVQGGLGGASGNAVAALLALEIALNKQLSGKRGCGWQRKLARTCRCS